MRYKDVYEETFKDMDKVFKEMDKVFKNMEKRMEDMMESVQTEGPKPPWQEWFAWRPVTIKGKRVWTKKVYRRKTNTYVNHDDWARYEYGDLFDVLHGAGK